MSFLKGKVKGEKNKHLLYCRLLIEELSFVTVSKEEIREVESADRNPKAVRYTTVSRYV